MSFSTAHNRRRLKYVATVNDDSLSENTDADHELRYIDIGNVDSTGSIHEVVTYRFEDAPSRARRKVRDGDVIISTVRTYLQAIAAISNPPDNLIVSTGFAVTRPNSNLLDAGFFKYALREPRFLWEVEARSTGVSYPAINASVLGDIQVELPPLKKQRMIATYLDQETATIDALVKEKERMLELLDEKRTALISQVVTRGLDSSVSTRSSGHAWLGNVPKHWDVERSKRVLTERNDRSTTGEEEMLTVSHLTGVTKRSEKEVNMFEAESTDGYKLVSPDNLVINTLWAWMGALGVSRDEGIVSPAYHVYILSPRFHPPFVELLVRTPAFVKEITRFSKGIWSSRLRLYPEGLFELYLPVPPLREQRAIVEEIRQEDERNVELRLTLADSIRLLKERRSALITAAVTGQVKPEAMDT